MSGTRSPCALDGKLFVSPLCLAGFLESIRLGLHAREGLVCDFSVWRSPGQVLRLSLNVPWANFRVVCISCAGFPV